MKLQNFIMKHSIKDFDIEHNQIETQPNASVEAELKKIIEVGDHNNNAMRENGTQSNKCSVCYKLFSTQARLRSQLQMEHLMTQQFQCNDCSAYVCPICSKAYKCKRNLQENMTVHKEDCEFICDFKDCNKAFKNERKLAYHQHVHTNIRIHICEICGYRTRYKFLLARRNRTHTGEKNYSFPTCGKHFISQSMVNEHKVTHSIERPHKCQICGRTFARPKSSYHHLHLHLDVKKFFCPICDKAYAQSAGLSAHKRRHKIEGKIGLNVQNKEKTLHKT